MIKKDCEYWETQEQNECYMFKPFDCSKCSKYKLKQRINIGIIGHVEHDKTTLTEALLKIMREKD